MSDLIQQLLSINTALTALKLSNQAIGPRGAALFARAITRNSTLTFLDLSYNNLGPVGIADVTEALARNHGLRELDLCSTSTEALGHRAVDGLANGLETSRQLRHVRMGSSSLLDARAIYTLGLAIRRRPPSRPEIVFGYEDQVPSDLADADVMRQLGVSRREPTPPASSHPLSPTPPVWYTQEEVVTWDSRRFVNELQAARRVRIEAMAMALHMRLGASSPARMLHGELLCLIVLPYCI